MDKDICFPGCICDIAGIIWFLKRVNLIEDASSGDCGEFGHPLLAAAGSEVEIERLKNSITDNFPGILHPLRPQARLARLSLCLQACCHGLAFVLLREPPRSKMSATEVSLV